MLFLVSFLRQRHQSRPPTPTNDHSISIGSTNVSSVDRHRALLQQPSAGAVIASQSSSSITNHNLEQNSYCSNNLEAVRQTPLPVGNSSPINHRNESSENLRNLFPCLYPINPHMRNKEARLQTFLDNSSIWPAHRIRATPQQIVDAGMYYLGERDRVKCWYCNGGLQNWERDDNPWEEHAKWFPLCEYVLQQKGSDYVQEIVARFPELRRPTLYNPSTSHASQTLVQNLNPGSNTITRTPPRNELTNQPEIVDPQLEIAERNRKISEEMRSSISVAQARMMGFDDNVIEESLKR